MTPFDPQTGTVNINPGIVAAAPPISGELIAAAEAAGFTAPEAGVIAEANEILGSGQLAEIAEAHAAGKATQVVINGRTILYEPGMNTSGMTMFGENGFVIGNQAFASQGELDQTVLHELYRLTASARAGGGGVSGPIASAETDDAWNFAGRAYDYLRRMGLR